MIVTRTNGSTFDTDNLRSGGDPTVDVELNPRELAALVVGNESPAGADPTVGDFARIPIDSPLRTDLVPDQLDRPGWHTRSTPPAVAKAWRAVEQMHEHLLSLADDYDLLSSEVAAARANTEAAAVAALRQGKTDPPAVATVPDVAARTEALRVQHVAARGVLAERRRAYSKAVSDALPAWREQVVAGHEPLLPAAQKALQDFLAAYGALTAGTAALAAMNHEIEPAWRESGTVDVRVRQARIDATSGLQSVTAVLNSSEPHVTGAYVRDPLGVDPPVYVRRRWSRESDAHRRHVEQIETEEKAAGNQRTSFVVPDAHGRTQD